jgi:hypothetical protein
MAIENGEILGPFNIPGAPLFSNPGILYIGKVSRDLRSRVPPSD